MLKKRFLAFLMSAMMLFSVCSFAQSGYVTVSDPYYSDGQREYDFTGLSVNLTAAAVPEMYQMIFRVITTAGQAAAAIEIEDDDISVYADGFMAEYTMTVEEYLAKLSPEVDEEEASRMTSGALYQDTVVNRKNGASFRVQDAVDHVYDRIYGDGSQLKDAKTATVDTFLHKKRSTFMVLFSYSPEELDRMIQAGIEKNENYLKIIELLTVNLPVASMLTSVYNIDPSMYTYAETGMVSFAALYENLIKPLELSMDGCIYYGENDIFAEISVKIEDEVVMPILFEITKAEKSSLYLKIPVGEKDESETVLYATIEGGENEYDDYVELGVLENGNTTLLTIYQVYEDKTTGMPVKDMYTGMARGAALYNISLLLSTDNETARTLYASAYLDGIELQFKYDGKIVSEYGEKNETGTLSFATNYGLVFRTNIGVGMGENDPFSIVPEGTERKPLSEAGSGDMSFLYDISRFAEKIDTLLQMGVPGFSQMMNYDDAEG